MLGVVCLTISDLIKREYVSTFLKKKRIWRDKATNYDEGGAIREDGEGDR